MAQRTEGSITIEQLIELAKHAGVELCEPPDLAVIGTDGIRRRVWFLRNPTNGKRFMLTDFDKGEFISNSIRKHAERRLKVNLETQH